MIPARFQPSPEATRVFGERLDRLAPYLLRSDPLADEASAALPAWERGFARIAEALRDGGGAPPSAPEPVRALIEHAQRVPVWVDWDAIERGGLAFLRSGILGGLVLGAGSLVLSFTSPGGNKPLVFSGRLQEQAPRRLAETSYYVRAVTRPGGLRPGGEGLVGTIHVRLLHAQLRRLMRESGRFRVDLWGEPINQHDMMGTLILFSVVVVESLARLGYRMSSAEAEDLVHLWRYAGYLIGVDADLLPGSFAEARRFGEMISATQGPPDDDSRALTRALLESPRTAAKTPEERRFAERRERIGAALVRHVVGDDMADTLGVPRTWARHLVPALSALVAATERARDLPVVKGWSLEAGYRYWDAAVARGLQDLSAVFVPPDRLAA